MQYHGKISFIIKHKEGDRLRIARTATTMPIGIDEVQRIIHTLGKVYASAFDDHAGFRYTFGKFVIGMEPPTEPHAEAFPYTLE